MHYKFSALISLCATVALGGCVQPAPIVDSHLGQSLSMIKAQQIINPEAARNDDPVAGMDGRAAKGAYDQYQKTYQAPQPQTNIFTIGIGSGR